MSRVLPLTVEIAHAQPRHRAPTHARVAHDREDREITRALASPRRPDQLVQRGLKGAGLLLDPGVEERDLLLEEFDVAEQALKHEDVVIRDATEQRFAQLRVLASQ